MSKRRSAISLTVIAFLLLAANFLFTAHYVNSTQQAQKQAGLLVEKAICTDLGTMAAIPAPAGAAARNPSRAYEQAEHRAWAGLDAGLGCKRIGR